MSDTYKNIVYQSAIYAEGNVHVGDKYIINGQPREIPFQLNTLPFIDQAEVIGREEDLKQVRHLLFQSEKVVLVNGLGGIGKTTLAKYLLALFREEYGYVAWVNNSSNIKEAFIDEVALIDSLCLRQELEELPKNDQWTDHAFQLIINRMRQLGGGLPTQKNLLVIDNAGEDIEHTLTLDQIALRPNWKVLVTSREKLLGFAEYELGLLSPEDAKRMFYLHYQREQKDELVEEILGLIDYHTLLIEVVAKTAQSLRLDLGNILGRLKKKGLNISEEDKPIKFPHHYNQKVFDVFEYLLEMFKMAGLSEYEQWVMMQFAVLPSIFLPYEEQYNDSILKLLQIKEEEKKDFFTRNLNRIVEKGWLQWDKKADAFKMHPVIQEILRFKLSPNVEHCKFLIRELYDRINYQHVDFGSKNHLFVQHVIQYVQGRSTDFAELLDEYASIRLRFYDYEDSIRLQTDALAMKKELLPENHIKLSDSYNSLALSFLSLGDYEKALEYQLRDLEITKINTLKEDYNLGITYNNLSLIYRKLGDFEKALFYQEVAIRIAGIILDPDLDNVVYNNMGNLKYLQKAFQKALEYFQKSLKVREKNDSDQLWISEAHYNLGTTYIELGALETARNHLDIAYEIEKEIVPDKSSFALIHHGYGLLYFKKGAYEKALAHFEESRNILVKNFPPDHHEVVRTENWIKKTNEITFSAQLNPKVDPN